MVQLTRSRPSRDQSISKWPEITSMNPLFPSKTSGGPVMPRIARKAAWVEQNAVLGYANPFQLDSVPVRVTLKALKAVPLIAIAFAVSLGLRPSSLDTPAATANDPSVVLSNPLARTGATSHNRQST